MFARIYITLLIFYRLAGPKKLAGNKAQLLPYVVRGFLYITIYVKECCLMAKNLRLEKFAKYYAASGNAIQSAIKAGYSEKTAKANAHKLLVKIGEKVKKEVAKEEKKIGLTREDKKRFLQELIERAKAGEIDPNVAMKAIDIDNKMDGEYITKNEHSGSVAVKFGWEEED